MRILIVEDDDKTADFVAKGFQQAGFSVCVARDGLDGLVRVRTEHFDVAIVDVMLPGIDGFKLIEEARKSGKWLPVLVLSAKDSVENKIKGLESGGDDYLAKPFSLAELLARVQALLRRSQLTAEVSVLKVADLTLDLISHKVFRGDQRIELQRLEYMLLEYLMRNKGRVVSKTTIMEHVWEYGFDAQTNIVESRVCRLREKIDKPFERKLIRTIRGFGYVLE